MASGRREGDLDLEILELSMEDVAPDHTEVLRRKEPVEPVEPVVVQTPKHGGFKHASHNFPDHV